MTSDWMRYRTSFDKFDGGEPRRADGLNRVQVRQDDELADADSAGAEMPRPPSHSVSAFTWSLDALKQCAAIDREGK